jgi:hypothetical protein
MISMANLNIILEEQGLMIGLLLYILFRIYYNKLELSINTLMGLKISS